MAKKTIYSISLLHIYGIILLHIDANIKSKSDLGQIITIHKEGDIFSRNYAIISIDHLRKNWLK